MSNAEESSGGRSPISPGKRKQLQQCFEHANKKMMHADHDYANELLVRCIVGDPGNVIYAQSFVGNLRQKYGNNKKGSKMAFIKSAKPKGLLKKAELQKHWDDVIEYGAEILQLNPWDTTALIAMSRAASELGYDDSQLAMLKMALDANPQDPDVNRLCGIELRAREEFDQALACWTRVVKAKPDDKEAQKAIGDITVEKTIAKGKYDRAAMQKTDEPIESTDDTSSASRLTPEQKLEHAIKKDPSIVPNYTKLAEMYAAQNLLKKSEDTLQRGLAASSDDPDIRSQLLEAQQRRLHHELLKVKQQFESAPSEEGKRRFYELKQQHSDKSLEMHRFRVERYPQNTTFRFDLGMTYQVAGQYKEAIAEFQQAKVDATLSGICLLALGQCFQQIKQYGLALKHYEEAVEAIPTKDIENKKKSLYLTAKLAFGLKETAKAEKFATELAGIDFSYKDVAELLDKISNQGNID